MFEVDGIIFQEVLDVIAENTAGTKMYYRLSQVSDCTIDVAADYTDSVDKYGSLIKRVYQAKTATVTLTNAHLDLNAYAAMAGSDKEIASEDNKLTVPRTIYVDATETSYVLPNTPVEGTIQVAAIKKTGALGTNYELSNDGTASETTFVYDESSLNITFPTLSDEDKTEITQFIIKYDTESDAAVMVKQLAKKFPKTIKLTIDALGYNPCEPDVLQLIRIIFPSFQPSPECSISMAADSTFDFTGDAQTDYCSLDKTLFYIVAAEDDIDEEDTED